jgi:putative hemolysin
VTLKDITSVIVSEEEQNSLKGWIKKHRDVWIADGLTDIHSAMEVLSVKEFPGDSDSYNTLGGMLMSVLDKIPQKGDVFEWKNLRFEILSMNGQRVDRIKISQPA